MAKDRIISTTDPEMRHDRKSSARLFDGYKTHTAIESENSFITEIEVTLGNAHDSEAATDLVDKQPEAIRPNEVLSDMAYGVGKNREEMERREIKLLCPVPTGIGRNGCFPKTAFNINLEAQTCQCPAGKMAPERIYDKNTNRLKVFVFSQEQCQSCPLLNQCSCKIESKQAEMVHHGLRQARYIGKAKVYLQSLLIGALVNFKRYWKLLAEQAKCDNSRSDAPVGFTKTPLPVAVGSSLP